jgi:hypothetical protein
MKPEDLAVKIMQAMERGTEDLIEADLMTHLAIYLKAMWPGLFSMTMNMRARKQRAKENRKMR